MVGIAWEAELSGLTPALPPVEKEPKDATSGRTSHDGIGHRSVIAAEFRQEYPNRNSRAHSYRKTLGKARFLRWSSPLPGPSDVDGRRSH